MVGGLWGALVPLLVLVTVLVWVSLADGGGTRSFWAGAWLALATGLLLARDKTAYCQSVVRGLGDKNGVVIVTAWLFAGVFGQLMVAGGLVDGLLWLGFNTGATGAAFATLTFVLCVLFALGTGTSTGMALALGGQAPPACAEGVYCFPSRCATGAACHDGCACIGGVCTSFSP